MSKLNKSVLNTLALTAIISACNGSGSGGSSSSSADASRSTAGQTTGGGNSNYNPNQPVLVGDRVVTTPVESDQVLANPFKGFAAPPGYGDTAIPMTLVYDDVTWAQLEPTKGNFNWDALEGDWDQEIAKGRKIGFRFKVADPWVGGANDVPQWLINAGVPMRAYSIDGGSGNAPDWDNETFLSEHARVLKALGERYNNDPRVAWLDIGSYGIWGEWHVWQNESLAATQASKQKILNDYFNNFPDKKMVIAFDDSFATNFVSTHGGGVRNDCLGDSASNDYYLSYMNEINPGIITDIYKKAIITGEFCNGSSGAQAGVTSGFSMNIDFIKETHWSFIGPAGGEIAEMDTANAKEMHKTLGYHFVVTEVVHEQNLSSNATMNLSLKVNNEAVAPFYYPWPLEISLVSADGELAKKKILSFDEADIRKWLPGESTINVTVPMNGVPTGQYKVGVAILDPATGNPGVMFGNEGRDSNGRYLFSDLIVQ